MDNTPLDKQLPVYLFHQGTNYRAYELLGAHFLSDDSAEFVTWAPSATGVSVVGDFNCWDTSRDPMERISEGGLWLCKVNGLAAMDNYKFAVFSNGSVHFKADPYAFYAQTPPETASRLLPASSYRWKDSEWLSQRKERDIFSSPLNIYEVHLGSWRKDGASDCCSYRELARTLPRYAKEMGFTHIEIMPVAEHPFGGSWGYQVSGFFAPSSRYGTPDDLRFFVDSCHEAKIGVIMDWVPAHFTKDGFGLIDFDGCACYEYADPKKAEHYSWGTRAFDYGKLEVQSFLVSSALYWIDQFHIDGLRVDAVSSMLYLDYGRKEGEWIPNAHGGRENTEACELLRKINSAVVSAYPDVMMIAEESTAWPSVTKPVSCGGLGFHFKWNMGWMNDILHYLSADPIFRSYEHNKLTFSMVYAFSENFLLPISHDEVVHGKGSLIQKMPGSDEDKFSSVRCFLAYMMSHPGKKLLFMGCELGQSAEWDNSRQLDWALLGYSSHQKLHFFVRSLNAFYLKNPAFWELDGSWDGFSWINADDSSRSVISYIRHDKNGGFIVAVCNFSGALWENYTVGVPRAQKYCEVFSTDDKDFGGSGIKNGTLIECSPLPCNSHDFSVSLTLAPLSAVFLIPLGIPPLSDSPSP